MNGADRLKHSEFVAHLGKMHVCKLEFGIADDNAHFPIAYREKTMSSFTTVAGPTGTGCNPDVVSC